MTETLTKVLHFAIGKPMAHHDKFAIKRMAKSTLANYGKLSHAKHCGKSGHLQATKEWQIMAFLPFLV